MGFKCRLLVVSVPSNVTQLLGCVTNILLLTNCTFCQVNQTSRNTCCITINAIQFPVVVLVTVVIGLTNSQDRHLLTPQGDVPLFSPRTDKEKALH